MTFIPNVTGKISTVNSTTSVLTASTSFTGTLEDITKYRSIEVNISTDVDSDAGGVSIQFSLDGTNWDMETVFTHIVTLSKYSYKVNATSKYFRLIYTNGGSGQSYLRLQTRFHFNNVDEKSLILPNSFDSFGRLRVSNPNTVFDVNHILNINTIDVSQVITGLGTSVHQLGASYVLMSTTGTGSIIRSTRKKGTYQPGKSLMMYMSGVLDKGGANASTVTTKMGYYNGGNGYYIQYVNGVVSIVERTSVSGSVVETKVAQSAWDENKMDGKSSPLLTLDKAIIFWVNLEWLGVGSVKCGFIYDNKLITAHTFRHIGTHDTPYTSTATLPVRWEIESTGGVGSMGCMCCTVLSEGGFLPVGRVFSHNFGVTTQQMSAGIEYMVMAIRIASTANSNLTVRLTDSSIHSVANSDGIIKIFKYTDPSPADGSGFFGSSGTSAIWTSPDPESGVEYMSGSGEAKANRRITTTDGYLLSSKYFNIYTLNIAFVNLDDVYITNNAVGVSDILVLVIQCYANEDFSASLTWKEII